ncbi:sugar kinase [Amnibacterium kyonggiense]|uniref:2-dehydro-3-deoxygluconokinase n=1 Tax=Amnibacterium kyonggiense TaxID=595671 RepID=A0A4R7FQC8_9MICO|nr:sugar kinase [Amnibacterium kyonggiense]TDS79987.1 2-dehydro-3-deoxygluconokinase [Amnibacterium kyonggiense]
MTVLTLGEALGVLHTGEPIAHASHLRIGTGGSEANVAIGLARLGARVAWLGRVGDDGLGRRIVRELRAEGVDVHAVLDPAAPTGLLLKETDPAGRTEVVYHRRGSAGSRLVPDDLDLVDAAAVTHLHVTGITPALSPDAAATVGAAVERWSPVGVSYDVNHRSRLWDAEVAATVHRTIAERVDVVFAGLDEALLLVPDADGPEDAARRIAALGPREVVVKLGEQGALALVDGVVSTVEAVPVRVVDTVGAGDAFVAGYLAERVRGLPVAARLRTAARAGALACTHPGDWEGLPFRRDLDRPIDGEPVAR